MHMQNTLAIIGILLFVVSMVRGCGGLMSGGCGMGGRRANLRRPHDQPEHADLGHSSEPVGRR